MFAAHHPTALHSRDLQVFAKVPVQDARQRHHAMATISAPIAPEKRSRGEAPIAADCHRAPASPTASVSSVESAHSDSESVEAAPVRDRTTSSPQHTKTPSSASVTAAAAVVKKTVEATVPTATTPTTVRSTAHTYRRFRAEAEMEPLSMDIHPRDKARYQLRGEQAPPSVFMEGVSGARMSGPAARASVLAPQRVQAWWPRQLELQEKQQQQLLHKGLSLAYTDVEDHDAQCTSWVSDPEPARKQQAQHTCHQPQTNQAQKQQGGESAGTSEALDAISRLQALRRDHAHARRRAKEERKQRQQQEQQQTQQQQQQQQQQPAMVAGGNFTQVGRTAAKRNAQEAPVAVVASAARNSGAGSARVPSGGVPAPKRAHVTLQQEEEEEAATRFPSATQTAGAGLSTHSDGEASSSSGRSRSSSSSSSSSSDVGTGPRVNRNAGSATKERHCFTGKGKAGRASRAAATTARATGNPKSSSSSHRGATGSPGRRKRSRKRASPPPPAATAPSTAASLVQRARPMMVAKSGNGCVCCGITSTPMWRDGPNDMRLCNACGIRWQKYGVHCTSCSYIPRKVEKARGVCPKCQTKLPAAVATRRRLNSKASH